VREGAGAPEGLSAITALGTGPAPRQAIHPFTKRLKPLELLVVEVRVILV
jgi:hypothetical protein